MLLCPIQKFCNSAFPDKTGNCVFFSTDECRFISQKTFTFACDNCAHAAYRHVDPRCKSCKLKNAVALTLVGGG